MEVECFTDFRRTVDALLADYSRSPASIWPMSPRRYNRQGSRRLLGKEREAAQQQHLGGGIVCVLPTARCALALFSFSVALYRALSPLSAARSDGAQCGNPPGGARRYWRRSSRSGSSSAWCGSGGGASSSSSSSASRSGGRGKASSSNEPVLETSTPFAFCNDWEQQTDGAPSPNHTIRVVRVDRQTICRAQGSRRRSPAQRRGSRPTRACFMTCQTAFHVGTRNSKRIVVPSQHFRHAVPAQRQCESLAVRGPARCPRIQLICGRYVLPRDG